MAYTVQDLAPIALGQCMRNQKTLSADAVVSAFNGLTEGLDLALAASQAEGRMFVFRDGTKYVYQGQIKSYGSLAEAIDDEQGFKGYAYIAEDIYSLSSFSGSNDKPFMVSGGRLVLDFNGRYVSVDMAADPGNLKSKAGDPDCSAFMLLSSNMDIMDEKGLPDVTLRNGEIFSPSDGRMFVVYHGSLKLENMKAELDCSNHKTGSYAAIIRMNGSKDKDFQRKAYASIDKDTEFLMTGCGKAPAMFQLFSSYFRLRGQFDSDRQAWLNYLSSSSLSSTEEDVAPEIFIDGKCRQIAPESGLEIISAQHNGDFDPMPNYPQITTGNGQDKGLSRIIVGPHAYINAGEGVGIYSGMRSEIKLEGGTIIGGTGIAIRGGTLIVPPDADPTVIGSGRFREYVPYHKLIKYWCINPDGSAELQSAGSDAQTFMNMGHAVVFESNGTGYGACGVSAHIGSGNFVSYCNTPFGSYGIALSSNTTPSSDAGVSYELDYGGSSHVSRFEKRLSGFVEACSSNRPPIGLEYNYKTGQFPDWQQTAPESLTRSGCQTYKAVPYMAQVENADSLDMMIPH